MDALIEELDTKLKKWNAVTVAEVRVRVAEVIVLADCEALDIMRSKKREQAVLDMLDEPHPGLSSAADQICRPTG
jgi:hypothetical protein